LLLWIVPTVLFAAAIFELALAVGLVGSYSGRAPGQDVEGENTVVEVAVLTMLAGSVVALAHAIRPRRPWTVALFAPAAAAFVTARFYTYDPYYLPDLRRYSDEGAVLDVWILGTLALAIVVGRATGLRPRGGSIATAAMLPWLVLTLALASSGH
jgi:hypothetical protein